LVVFNELVIDRIVCFIVPGMEEGGKLCDRTNNIRDIMRTRHHHEEAEITRNHKNDNSDRQVQRRNCCMKSEKNTILSHFNC